MSVGRIQLEILSSGFCLVARVLQVRGPNCMLRLRTFQPLLHGKHSQVPVPFRGSALRCVHSAWISIQTETLLTRRLSPFTPGKALSSFYNELLRSLCLNESPVQYNGFLFVGACDYHASCL